MARRHPDLKRALEKQLSLLTAMEVGIGIPGDAAPFADGRPITAAQLGYLQETGCPFSNIPPRPFLRPGVEKIRAEAVKMMKAALRKAVDKNDPDIAENVLHEVGLMGQLSVQNTIREGIPPPLAASTIYKRQHRTHNRREAGYTTPLIDTGDLLKRITYVILKGPRHG